MGLKERRKGHNDMKCNVVVIVLFVVILILSHAGASHGDTLRDGIRAYELGDFTGAIDAFEKALVENPKDLSAEANCLLYLSKSYLYAGRFDNALAVLNKIPPIMEKSESEVLKQEMLNVYGLIYMATGDFNKANEYYGSALQISERQGIRAGILNNLGTLHVLINSKEKAMEFYEYGLRLSRIQTDDQTLRAQILTNIAVLNISQKEESKSVEKLKDALLIFQGAANSHKKVEGLVNVAKAYMSMSGKSNIHNACSALDDAQTAAGLIADNNALPYIYIYKSKLYEEQQDYKSALVLLKKSLYAASMSALKESVYITYRQMGRIFSKTGKTDDAITAYREAVRAIENVGLDAFVNCALCGGSFFKTEIESVFYELAEALIERASKKGSPSESQKDLYDAIDTIEQLRAAELKDYFKDTCIDIQKAKESRLDTVSKNTAILYVVSFPEKLYVLVSFPSGIKKYMVNIASDDYTQEVLTFRRLLEKRTTMQFLAHGQRLYDILIRPIEQDLALNETDTIVYIPDMALRMIPLGALHDGKDFLIRKYAVAGTVGVFLTDAGAFTQKDSRMLVTALTEPRQGHVPLPFISDEVRGIGQEYNSSLLMNKDFVLPNLKNEFKDKQYNMLHMASHGEFTGDAAKAFIVTWDGKMTINDLETQIKEGRYSAKPIEILALSACETAAGDEKAALGLAGLSVKMGVKSTIASLWSVNDEATSILLVDFYKELKTSGGLKAKALRRAQMNMLDGERFSHPLYWAPFLLIGNWL
ncbi:CHAT domain-containing protein [Candidatus Magnetominusculus dajiuhuensis]|uniref:CHAT domain-containing protein n=1 Tax=Candidatus Magnetominusculus dajiuhuensis TaxID=3137712 RepID=UPI003B43A1E6